jgi:hypothetical protein
MLIGAASTGGARGTTMEASGAGCPRPSITSIHVAEERPVSSFRHRLARLAGLRLRAVMPVFILSMTLGGAAAGCGSPAMTTPSAASTGGAVTAEARVPMGDMTMPTGAEIGTAWAARPDYVKQLPDVGQEAYKFALARPDVLQWLPCYCGCAGMEHRSNLDCFFVRREVKGAFDYEEHASFCDICVKTANLASRMLREGSTMVQIRAAVDGQFGNGAAPGTDTPMPPAA